MNKYKVGDYLVAKRKFKSNELFKVDRIGRNGELYDNTWRVLVRNDNYELANPEEIKAGKRL